MAEQSTDNGTLTEKPDDMSFADWKKYRSNLNQSKSKSTASARDSSTRNSAYLDQRNRTHHRITDYDPRNNMQMAPPFPPFSPFQPPFPFFQGPPPHPWVFSNFSDDFGPPTFFNSRQKYEPRDDFFIGSCAPPPRNPRNPFNGPPAGFDHSQMFPPVHPKKFFKKDTPGGPVRPSAKKKMAKKKSKQTASNSNNTENANTKNVDGAMTVKRQPELYIPAANGGPAGWVRKPPPPPPLEATDTGEMLEEKQRMWKEYRTAMKPFKHRDFANAKRTIQRFGKRSDLDDKEQARLQRAQEFVSAHKAMLSQKAALRQNQFDIHIIPGTVTNEILSQRPPPPPPLPQQPSGGIHWVRQQDLNDNPTIRGAVIQAPRNAELTSQMREPHKADCVIEIPDAPQHIQTVTTTCTLANSHQSAWQLRQELTKLESLVDMAEFTGS